MKSKNLAFVNIFVLLAMALTVAGCQKWSHNGDLDGQWQVMEVKYSGTPIEFPEGERFYYDFYLNTFQLGFTDTRPSRLKGNMKYLGNKLLLDLPYIKSGRVPKEWIDRLVYWGMPESGEVDLTIRHLDSSSLVMEYNDVVITCRKF